jgi:hypothetical protein
MYKFSCRDNWQLFSYKSKNQVPSESYTLRASSPGKFVGLFIQTDSLSLSYLVIRTDVLVCA